MKVKVDSIILDRIAKKAKHDSLIPYTREDIKSITITYSAINVDMSDGERYFISPIEIW